MPPRQSAPAGHTSHSDAPRETVPDGYLTPEEARAALKAEKKARRKLNKAAKRAAAGLEGTARFGARNENRAARRFCDF